MSYVIAGRKVASEWLSIATLVTTFSLVGFAMSGSPKAKTEQLKKETPPIEAATGSEEESFILNFIKEEEQKANSAMPAAH